MLMPVHRRKRSIPAIIAPETRSVTDHSTVHLVLDGISAVISPALFGTAIPSALPELTVLLRRDVTII